jgi:hypothetical protein
MLAYKFSATSSRIHMDVQDKSWTPFLAENGDTPIATPLSAAPVGWSRFELVCPLRLNRVIKILKRP